jgi:hypothetical protein
MKITVRLLLTLLFVLVLPLYSMGASMPERCQNSSAATAVTVMVDVPSLDRAYQPSAGNVASAAGSCSSISAACGAHASIPAIAAPQTYMALRPVYASISDELALKDFPQTLLRPPPPALTLGFW